MQRGMQESDAIEQCKKPVQESNGGEGGMACEVCNRAMQGMTGQLLCCYS
jgi:hypothetical protein